MPYELEAESSLPLFYELAFLRCDISKLNTLKDFLVKLRSILPVDCQPIIVTDAGFKNPWFKEIKRLGWDYTTDTWKCDV
jgi:hypothetical protein